MFNFFNQQPKTEPTRKEKTELYLAEKGVEINYDLPHLAPDTSVTLRTPTEIAERTLVLSFTVLIGEGILSPKDCVGLLKAYGLWQFVTPGEKSFLYKPTPQGIINESWKSERIWTLLWALKIVDDLTYPDRPIHLDLSVPPEKYLEYILGEEEPLLFISHHQQTRSVAEILDANDLYYRMDWACVEAHIFGREVGAGLDPSVVRERHYTLNWLTQYANADWDSVPCDT